METALRPTMLVIADITGYTRFMLANRQAQVHSVLIIHELIDAIIREIDIPLEVSKLEGDAVFMYAAKDAQEPPWAEETKTMGARLLRFFAVFSEKIVDLAGSTMCRCPACDNIGELKLKIVVHSGEAVFSRVGDSDELAGLDVVTVHSLLKNSVSAGEYILMTDAGRQDIVFPEQVELAEGEESYDEIGTIKTHIYLPGGETQRAESIEDRRRSVSFLTKMRVTMGTMMKSLPMLMGLIRHPSMHQHGAER